MRLWYFASSVNSFFKRACAAIQWGQMSDFWLDPSSTSILHVWNSEYHGSCNIIEPQHDKANKIACAPSEDSDQLGHPPSLIRVFAVRTRKPWVLRYPLSAQRRLWSDWADAQANLSLRWVHTHFVGFVISWLNCYTYIKPYLLDFSKATFLRLRDWVWQF